MNTESLSLTGVAEPIAALCLSVLATETLPPGHLRARPLPAAGVEHAPGTDTTDAATPADTLERAGRLIRTGRGAEALPLLEAVVARGDAAPRAWMLLGLARHAAGEHEAALRAHRKAADFEETRPRALFNAGLTLAALGRVDEALERLEAAKTTGRVDVTRLAVEDDAEALRDDPRYRRLFPSGEELADPFVESVRVLHEWRGESPLDEFGWIARDAGDVDGDGVHDVVTSAPSAAGPDGGERAGAVYLYSGRSRRLLWKASGRAEERLGVGVEAAGDVDADGVPDVVAGAPGGDRTVVYSGADGSVLLELGALEEGEGFGRKVSDLGDVNGDGRDDVLVGAPGNDAEGEDAGAAYVFSGRDGELLLVLRGEAGDRLGSAGDGRTAGDELLLAVGAPDAGPDDRGRVRVYRLHRDEPRGAGPEPAFTIEPEPGDRELGAMFVSVVGDVNADGTADVYGTDWSSAAKGSTTGRAYVHSGTDGRRLHQWTGEAAGDGFGIGPADAGDVDGDGHDDLVIGAWRHGGAAPAGGKVYVYSGRDGRLMRTITGKVMGETLGFDATGTGDVDGDGVPDLLLTSAWSTVNGARSGRMWLVAGERPEESP